MKEVNVTLKFITPTFVGAAENKRVSEFRIPSLKGLLRFWWRVYQDFPRETELYKAESQIFGDTEHKASFSISLDQSLQNLIFTKPGYPFNIKQDGIKYLFFSMYRKTGRTAWLPANTTVDLQFRFFDEQNVKEVITALWWLENFGGIGARSRRGAGSFQITKIEPIEGIQGIPQFMCQKWSPKTGNLKENILGFLETGINSSYRPRSSQIPSYTAFRENISNYKVLARYTSWEDAANNIGTKLVGFPKPNRPPRSARFEDESKAIHSFSSSGSYPSQGPNPLARPAFGLPIQYYFRDHTKVEASGSVHSRRASPLFVKIGCMPNGDQYYVIVLSLWSEFLPDNEELKIEISEGSHNGKTQNLNQPDKTVIDNFLSSL